MADRSSSSIAALESNYPTSALLVGGGAVSYVGKADVLASDGAGDKVKLFRLPLERRVSSLKILNDGLGAGCTMSLGLYRPGAEAVIDVDFFGATLAMTAARSAPLEQDGKASLSLANKEKTLKQILEDAGVDLEGISTVEVVGTFVGAPASTGSVSVEALVV